MSNTGRSCEGCTACCFALPIANLEGKFKPAGQPCRHRDASKGCLIYPKRQKECRDFACQWRMGFLGLHDRPDVLGILWDRVSLPSISPVGKLMNGWEVKEGALDSVAAWEETRLNIEKGILVCHFPLSGRGRLFIPFGDEISQNMKKFAGTLNLEVLHFSV